MRRAKRGKGVVQGPRVQDEGEDEDIVRSFRM
jgi:hypothetical protein